MKYLICKVLRQVNFLNRYKLEIYGDANLFNSAKIFFDNFFWDFSLIIECSFDIQEVVEE